MTGVVLVLGLGACEPSSPGKPAPTQPTGPTLPSPTTTTTTPPVSPPASMPAQATWQANLAASVAHGGDIDADGVGELLVSGGGAVVLLTEPLVGGAVPPPIGLPFAAAGWLTAGGDADADGASDWWALGDDGVARLVSGVGPTVLATADVIDVRQVGDWPAQSFVSGDIDGDGAADLVATDDERLAWFAGADGGGLTGAIVHRPYESGQMCGTVGDLDGDGVDDLAAWIGWGQRYDDWDNGDSDGDVYVFSAPPAGDLALDDAQARLFGAAVHVEPLDWNGDGSLDLALFGSAGPYDYYSGIAPVVWLVSGPVRDGADATIEADATVLVDFPGYPQTGGYTGPTYPSLATPPGGSPGDLDGDGADELVVSVRTFGGNTWVVRGGSTGVTMASDDLLLAVPAYAELAGGRGDVDGDGGDDLVLLIHGAGTAVGVWSGAAL